MSILSDLRLKHRGQLDQLRKQRANLESAANDALIIVLMKSDPHAPIETLSTDAILRAAKNLHDTVTVIKTVDNQIAMIDEELNG